MAGKRRGRKAYLDDYKINETGEYEYQGARYQWQINETERQKILYQFRFIGIFNVAVSLLAGCIPAPGVNHSAYLLLPYSIGVVAAISLCLALWRASMEKNPMREHIYKGSVEKLPFRSILTAVFTGLSIVGEVIYVFLHGSEGALVYAVLFILLEAAAMACAIYIRRKSAGLSFEVLPKDAGTQ